MNTSMLTESEFLQHIKKQLGLYDSQKAMADAMHITPAYLSDVLNGKRAISEKIAQFFGRKRVVLYVIPDKKKGQEQS